MESSFACSHSMWCVKKAAARRDARRPGECTRCQCGTPSRPSPLTTHTCTSATAQSWVLVAHSASAPTFKSTAASRQDAQGGAAGTRREQGELRRQRKTPTTHSTNRQTPTDCANRAHRSGSRRDGTQCGTYCRGAKESRGTNSALQLSWQQAGRFLPMHTCTQSHPHWWPGSFRHTTHPQPQPRAHNQLCLMHLGWATAVGVDCCWSWSLSKSQSTNFPILPPPLLGNGDSRTLFAAVQMPPHPRMRTDPLERRPQHTQGHSKARHSQAHTLLVRRKRGRAGQADPQAGPVGTRLDHPKPNPPRVAN